MDSAIPSVVRTAGQPSVDADDAFNTFWMGCFTKAECAFATAKSVLAARPRYRDAYHPLGTGDAPL
jgi:hypothetical protein